MNSVVHQHPARLQAPFYSLSQQGRGAELHRYFEPEFVNLFQRDLQRRSLGNPALSRWKIDDAFSGLDQKPVLRLPMHKSFYLFSCEVVCDRPGKPALDPQKIASAGFVIRRISSKGEQSWMLEDDQALGWQASPTGLRDPDLSRRCCEPGPNGKTKVKLRGQIAPEKPLTFTGEQTHPLHPVKAFDAEGKCHTVLFGYVPLGGTYMFRQPLNSQALNSKPLNSKPFTDDSLVAFKDANAAQLLWPFGFKTSDQSWTNECARPVTPQAPSLAFFELLKHLVNRYHLGEAGVVLNSGLEAWAERQFFYDEAANNTLSPSYFTDYNRANFAGARRGNLGQWFKTQAIALVEYMARQEKRVDEGQSLQPLPGVSHSLYITQADAQELRNLLDQRVLNHALDKVKEIPLPKFGQELHDIYQIVPFVRLRNECGGEDIVWGDGQVRSEIFRVAAPFDPNASRPSLIQMPSLKDLRKGMAQGVSMLTPPDTFNLLNALNLKKGVTDDVIGAPKVTIGIQWICSFSLPAITLVAMILLMIMISLLNIVFFWLPWVRICLPFPSIKKE